MAIFVVRTEWMVVLWVVLQKHLQLINNKLQNILDVAENHEDRFLANLSMNAKFSNYYNFQ